MSTYVRPAWPDPVFRDRAGAVMSYGSRWRSDGPPPETYSLVTHSDRFVPLHLVADALIGYLQETYDVQVTWDASYAEDFLRSPDLERVARVTPNDSAAAPLTIGLSTFPWTPPARRTAPRFRLPGMRLRCLRRNGRR